MKNSTVRRNRYIITEFSHLSVMRDVAYSPSKILAYFIPYRYNNSGVYNEDLTQELEAKERYIKNIPRFRNVQQQGFGNVNLRTKDICFSYFYNRVCKFEKHMCLYGLETSDLKQEIADIIEIDHLLLKVNHEIPERVKILIKKDLSKITVKEVMAKMLLYIVRGDSDRWPAESECKVESMMDMRNMFPEYIFDHNVFMSFRGEMDDTAEHIYSRLKDARHIQMMFLCGSSIFGGSEVSRAYDGSIYDVICRLFCDSGENKNTISMDILLLDSMAYAAEEAVNYKIYPTQELLSKRNIIRRCCERITETAKNVNVDGNRDQFMVKTTSVSLPYALTIVLYDDQNKDYIKVDLYSPCIMDNKKRPSMYIFRNLHRSLFEHFFDVFKTIWGSEQFSKYIDLNI